MNLSLLMGPRGNQARVNGARGRRSLDERLSNK
jgi:hypothetical protein